MTTRSSGGRGTTPNRRPESVAHQDHRPAVHSDTHRRQEPAPGALFGASIGSYGDTNFMLPGDEGRARRDDGVARADRLADAGWKAEADRIVGELAAAGRDFCADDLHDAGLSTAINSSAVGGRLLAAARAGIIVKVGYTTSTRPGRRAGATAVWRGAR